jgi:8-oxo-dGTP diphosphatase
LFGGHRKHNETFLECVVREVHQEISYLVPPERFEHLTSYTNVDADGGTVSGEMLVARDIPHLRLVITEGWLLVVDAGEWQSLKERLAPSTLAAIKAFQKRR